MLNKTGVPTLKQIESIFPKRSVLIKPKAVIECYEDIPCNPCETSCPFDAIKIGDNINTQPSLDVDACTGCAICVPSCPGLAIIIASIKEDRAWFKIPYEFLPKPIKGDLWDGVNREGNIICDATIESVMHSPKNDHTTLVTVSVPEAFLYDFITIQVKKHEK
jgi:Fe-S-cluster-containing hydrogenase component 2